MSNKRLKNISRKVKPKSGSYQSTFEQRARDARRRIRRQRSFSHDRAIRDEHRSGTHRVVPILRPVVLAMDHLEVQLPKAAARVKS